MALIHCPECNNVVSSHAPTCPTCAYPLSGGGTTNAQGGKTQTIEKTSKPLKLQLLLATLLLLSGLVVGVASSADGGRPVGLGIGVAVFVIGFIWFCLTKFYIWWYHA